MLVTIIESVDEAIIFKNQLSDENFVIFPLFESDVHPFCTSPVLLLARNINSEDTFVLPHSHSECLPFFDNFDILNTAKCFILDKKYLNSPESSDLDAMMYSSNKNIVLNIHTKPLSWSTHPLYMIIDYLDRDLSQMAELCRNFVKNESFVFLNTITNPTLAELEKNGLKVDREVFMKYFDREDLLCKNDFVFTQYNYLTSTGRPSNRFGGINFSALNKTDGSRESFISRFDGGELYLLDYESYHPRLISKLIDVELPAGSIHEYFGRLYFNKLDLTPDEYEESKKITFRLIYGNITDEYKSIEYFKKIDDMIESMWEQYQNLGYVRSVISGLKLHASSKTKLFNYLIQNYETEMNMIILQKILNVSKTMLSKPILYTYDAILLDVHPDESSYVNSVRDVMETDGFKVKVYKGKNYNDMGHIVM